MLMRSLAIPPSRISRRAPLLQNWTLPAPARVYAILDGTAPTDGTDSAALLATDFDASDAMLWYYWLLLCKEQTCAGGARELKDAGSRRCFCAYLVLPSRAHAPNPRQCMRIEEPNFSS
ncbi:hypothetical protein BV25DRAFT_1828506, partial [Artomyces pyxidatus]